MFVVTSAGVIATDPIGYGRPQAVTTYVDEIKKVTNQPIKYLIYSHHHFDHIAGGKPFKDAGATVVAHTRGQERLGRAQGSAHGPARRDGDVSRTITLGDTTLELTYLGLNHSDSTIVMRLPKEKVMFAVDFVSVGILPGTRHDRFLPDRVGGVAEEGARDGLGQADSRPPRCSGRTARHQAGRPGLLTFLQDASAEVKAEAQAGKCWDAVEKELKLPKYETWPGYGQDLPIVLRRYCGLWGRGT